MDIVESRLVYELDNIIGQAPKDASFILSLVTNTAGSPPGLVRSLFYGRPIWTVADGTPGHRRYGFQVGEKPALFQEEQYAGLGGTLIVDQPEGRGPCGWPTSILGPAVHFSPRMSRAPSSRRNAKKRKTASASCAGLSQARARVARRA